MEYYFTFYKVLLYLLYTVKIIITLINGLKISRPKEIMYKRRSSMKHSSGFVYITTAANEQKH